MKAALTILALVLTVAFGATVARAQPASLEARAPKNDNGLHLEVTWKGAPPDGQLTVIARHALASRDASVTAPPDKVPFDAKAGDDLGGGWTVAYVGVEEALTDEVDAETPHVYAAWYVGKDTVSPSAMVGPATPVAALYNTDRWFYLAIIVLTGVAFWLYLGTARKNAAGIFIRRMPGVDAIEDAIGRSTEMGRPVLYVTGVEEVQDIQTIASLLILGHVSRLTAEYDTDIKVANAYPMTMIVAEEVVRQGYANAGRIDAHRPENVMFITSEQFAFAAALTGMIVRDRPATNIYFGRFFAESLLLAETGFLTGSVQIAGTAEFTQLPFFVAACDYTLLGEELYATSAYLSREPTLLAQLKAGDVVKAVSMALIVLGVILETTGVMHLGERLIP